MFLAKNTKSPYYQLVYFIDGKRTTVSTKTTNLKAANKFIESFQVVPKPVSSRPISMTLNDFYCEYLEYIRLGKSKAYIKSIKLSFNMLVKYSGDIKINQISIRLLDKFIMETHKRAPRSASLYYRTLKAAFSKAVVWNYLSDNPFKNIKSPKVIKKLPFFIKEEEFNRIIEHTPHLHLKELFITAYRSGMRLGEVINMQWGWVDFSDNSVMVKCSENFITKSKKERLIPLSKELTNILKDRYFRMDRPIPEEYVFNCIKGKRLNEDFISKKFKQAIRLAELDERIHFHTLRHSFASMLVQRGVSLYVVKELLGHEDLSTTQIYSHLQKENLFEAIQQI